MTITEINVRMASKEESQLIAFASLIIDEHLYVNNIALRRKADGTLYLSFPRYRSPGGNEYPYFKPITKTLYDEIKSALISALNMEKLK